MPVIARQTVMAHFRQIADAVDEYIAAGGRLMALHDAGTEDSEQLEVVADRLEAALERIVRRLEAPRAVKPTAELAARLDGLIGRLRDVLGDNRD